MNESPALLKRLRNSFSEITQPDEFILQTALNEAWFSNTLAWLLDPRGSHGLGISFCQAFVALVAQYRTEGSVEGAYTRRATFLKHGTEGAGVSAIGFSFRNAASLREYYLSRSIDRRFDRRTRYCDVVFLDLDSRDNFFLAIENKLFTSDHDDQLREYREAIDTKYERAAVRELVYLTLRGEAPVSAGDDGERKQWIRLSWTTDIAGILKDLTASSRNELHPQVASLVQLLDWLEQVTDLDRVSMEDRVAFKRMLLRAAAECLFEELVRLDKPDRGHWSIEDSTESAERISYTVRTAAYLSVELTPGLTVTVQGRQYSGKAEFDKIVVPFGAHPDQVTNLLDIAARDVFHKFFQRHADYLGDARRLRTTLTEKEIQHRPVFEFVNKHRHALKPMLLQSREVRARVGIKDEEAAEAQ
jgi:hypothetical protein